MDSMSSDTQSKWVYHDDVDGFGSPGWQRWYSPSLKAYCHPDSFGQYKTSWGVSDRASHRFHCAHADSIDEGKYNADRLAFLFVLEKLIYGKSLADRIESLG